MASQITCECGYVARAESDREVVALIRAHLRCDHPQLSESVTDEVILSWVEIAT